MTDQLQHKNSAGSNEATLPAEFIAVCVLAFVAGVSATVYFCHSMCCEMEMPGGWTMSMMWRRMRGQTWFGSATSTGARQGRCPEPGFYQFPSIVRLSSLTELFPYPRKGPRQNWSTATTRRISSSG